MKSEELEERFKNLKLEFETIKDLKGKKMLDSKYDLYMLEAHGFDISKYKMTHEESCSLKEILRVDYLAILDFNEKFLFWQRHYDELRYITDFELQRQMVKSNDSSEVTRIRTIQDIEDQAKGISEPKPKTDKEKAFVARYWLEIELSVRIGNNPLMYDFEAFKQDFKSNLEDYTKHEDEKENKLFFAGKKLEEVLNQIEKIIRFEKDHAGFEFVYLPNEKDKKSSKKETLEYFFEDYVGRMHNEQKMLVLLYRCSKINYSLYEYASYLIPLYQCKKYLKFFIKR